MTPRMLPRVFTPYTHPMARSPSPAESRVLVMSGRVMPAQKVAGSMMSRATPYRNRLKSPYPERFRFRAQSRSAVHPKEAM